MDVEALRTFVAVAETGQFQAAADELGISQQTVSKRVAALERHIEVTLLVRTSRGSRLSLDGQVFLPHAKKVLAAIEQAVHPGSAPCWGRARRCDRRAGVGVDDDLVVGGVPVVLRRLGDLVVADGDQGPVHDQHGEPAVPLAGLERERRPEVVPMMRSVADFDTPKSGAS